MCVTGSQGKCGLMDLLLTRAKGFYAFVRSLNCSRNDDDVDGRSLGRGPGGDVGAGLFSLGDVDSDGQHRRRARITEVAEAGVDDEIKDLARREVEVAGHPDRFAYAE